MQLAKKSAEHYKVTTIHRNSVLQALPYLDGVLVRVAEVHGLRVVAIHEADQALHEVVHELEGAGLQTVPVDRDVLALQGLQ